jgi:hypothetical protein
MTARAAVAADMRTDITSIAAAAVVAAGRRSTLANEERAERRVFYFTAARIR